MALTGSGTISMSDMRTEFGISGSVSMSDLYRGGSEVSSTATTTVGSSVATLAGSASVSTGISGNFFNNNQARLTGAITCGSNGNVTANGNIVFTTSGSNNDSAPDIGGSMSGGVRIVSSDATFNSAGTVTGGTTYKSFTGVTSAWTCTGASSTCISGYGTLTTTITSGTSLSVPSGVTSFKILTYGFCNARLRGDNEGTAGLTLNNGSGSITSTSTSNVNTGVPASGTISFSDLYGAVG